MNIQYQIKSVRPSFDDGSKSYKRSLTLFGVMLVIFIGVIVAEIVGVWS